MDSFRFITSSIGGQKLNEGDFLFDEQRICGNVTGCVQSKIVHRVW